MRAVGDPLLDTIDSWLEKANHELDDLQRRIDDIREEVARVVAEREEAQ